MAKMNWKSKNEIEKEQRERNRKQKLEKEIEVQAETMIKFLQHELDRLIEKEELTEEQKQDFLNLYDPFEVGKFYKAGEKIRLDGIVYEVIQEHTSQSDWLPADVPALFRVYLQRTAEIDDGEELEVIHEWVKPTGGHDAYSVGDKVRFEGEIYESLLETNVWSPIEYAQGWRRLE